MVSIPAKRTCLFTQEEAKLEVLAGQQVSGEQLYSTALGYDRLKARSRGLQLT